MEIVPSKSRVPNAVSPGNGRARKETIPTIATHYRTVAQTSDEARRHARVEIGGEKRSS